jgi:hypothetical protein
MVGAGKDDLEVVWNLVAEFNQFRGEFAERAEPRGREVDADEFALQCGGIYWVSIRINKGFADEVVEIKILGRCFCGFFVFSEGFWFCICMPVDYRKIPKLRKAGQVWRVFSRVGFAVQKGASKD